MIQESSAQNNSGLPENDDSSASREVRQESLSVGYSGPLPLPWMMADYDKAVPNGSEQIMAMAEEQQKSRISNETLPLKEGIKIEKRGQVLVFLICLFALSVSAFLACNGHEVTTSIDLVTLAFVFNKTSHGSLRKAIYWNACSQ
ncbi:MAG: DUF2335 domain-containing protein [Chlorobium sp.]